MSPLGLSHSAGIWEVEMCLTVAGYDKQLIGRLRRLLSAFRSFWSLFEFMCVQIPDLFNCLYRRGCPLSGTVIYFLG